MAEQIMRSIWLTALIIAAALLGAAATAASAEGTSPTISGRVIYVPRTTYESSRVTTGLTDIVYTKLPSQESVRLTVSNPLLDSDIDLFKWSPDASRILFIAKLKGKRSYVPWILDLRTKKLEPVVQPGKDTLYWAVDWLSDGRRIIAWVGPYAEWHDKDTRVVVIDLKTKSERTIWRRGLPEYVCSSSRDEFIVRTSDGRRYIYHLVSVDYGLKWKTNGLARRENAMSFSPDGQKIAMYVNDKLYTVDCRTKARRLIYTNTEGDPPRSIVWSPDSKWIAFRDSRNVGVSVDPPVVDFGWAVIAVNAETKQVHEFPEEVYRQGKYAYTPGILGWTRDSRNLVLSVPEYMGGSSSYQTRAQLVLCPLTGGKGAWIADIAGYVLAIDWLPR